MSRSNTVEGLDLSPLYRTNATIRKGDDCQMDQQEGDVILSVRNLNKVYGEPEAVRKAVAMIEEGVSKDEIKDATGAVIGVRDATFDVHRGEFFVIMGLSGSGKSTLARCLIRLVEPTTGEMIIDGDDVATANREHLREIRRTKLAMVFQHYGLLPHKTVYENVEYGLRTRGVKEKERREAVLAAIAQVGLSGWEDSRPSALSGGMQQRVGLARALAHNPRILLMDEPFSGLDPLIRRDMQDEFAMLRAEEAITTIFVTHDLDEALKLGDRIAIMRDGEIIQIATPAELVTKPADDYVERFVEGASPARFMTADQLMEEDVATVLATASVIEATEYFNRRNLHSAFVVDDNNRLEGILSWWAIAKRPDGTVSDHTKSIASASPNTRLEDIVPLAVDSDYPVPIVGEDNELVGAVRRLDLLQTLARDLEEDVDFDSSTSENGRVQQEEPENDEATSTLNRTAIGD
ncbi:glycine betaine/L-proline ABC transporter ATP-binding protein [soil metagenome]